MDSSKDLDILIADDDLDDCLLLQEALEETLVANRVRFMHNGEELLDYLQHSQRLPGLILLDLNMPLMDGRQALAEIKGDSNLRGIPVIVLTTSATMDDVRQSYACGANAFITKPATYSGMLAMVRSLRSFWIDTATLPAENRSS